MAYPNLPNNPTLPKPTGKNDVRSLAAYDADMLKSLVRALSDVSRAFNQLQPARAITTRPVFKGQIAVVGTTPYIAVGTTSTADWKEITVV